MVRSTLAGTARKRMVPFLGLGEIRPDDGVGLFVWRLPVNGTVAVEEARKLSDGTFVGGPESGFVMSDIRGSVVAETDLQGVPAIVEAHEYDPYGDERAVGALPLSEHGYVGGERDPEFGVYTYGVRTYDPSLRRWLSQEPEWLGQGPIGLNAYQYANNNPIVHVDATGLASKVVVDGSQVNITSTFVIHPTSGYLKAGGSLKDLEGSVAPALKASVEKRWSNVAFNAGGKAYTLNVTVNVIVVQDIKAAEETSVALAKNGTPNDVWSIAEAGHGTNHAATKVDKETSRGTTVSGASILVGGATAAHETGHLLGLPNEPDNAAPEHARHLMAPPGLPDRRTASAHDAADIVRNNKIDLKSKGEQRANQLNMPLH